MTRLLCKCYCDFYNVILIVVVIYTLEKDSEMFMWYVRFNFICITLF